MGKNSNNGAGSNNNADSNDSRASDISDTLTAGTDENLQKVREILFGANVRGINEEIRSLSEAINAKFDSLIDEQTKKLKALESEVNSRFEEVLDKLKTEAGERIDSYSELSLAKNNLGKELDNFRQESEASNKEVRDIIDIETRKINDSLSSKQENLNSLESKKADRELISELLSDIALKLRDADTNH